MLTEERWHPATLLLLVRKASPCGEELQERSIAVQSRAVRWGNEAVGLRFSIAAAHSRRRGEPAGLGDAGEPGVPERFLQQLRRGRI